MPAEGDVIETTPTPAAVIFAGGDPIPAGEMPRLPEHRFVIAADGGLHAAQALGVAVDLVIGDFDSATPAALDAARRAGAVLERHPVDKDATDLELALDACLDRGLSPAVVVGGAGFDRIDHFLANALLLTAPRYAAMRLEWRVKGARVVPVHDRIEIGGAPGDVVTLLPIGGGAAGITTTGLRWPLQAATLDPGSTRGVSNEMTGSAAVVGLEQGTLLAIHTGGNR
ncbi:MAG: thiamine diphosphokinase [Actinobacteria bacterium]|nr:thiamine diphosphokinase [Actinomycetota bacterium]